MLYFLYCIFSILQITWTKYIPFEAVKRGAEKSETYIFFFEIFRIELSARS